MTILITAVVVILFLIPFWQFLLPCVVNLSHAILKSYDNSALESKLQSFFLSTWLWIWVWWGSIHRPVHQNLKTYLTVWNFLIKNIMFSKLSRMNFFFVVIILKIHVEKTGECHCRQEQYRHLQYAFAKSNICNLQQANYHLCPTLALKNEKYKIRYLLILIILINIETMLF